MTTHPYISGPGNISQMISFLRKNFPPTVNSETVKKLGLASNNESYVINALQFIGVIGEDGKRTTRGQEIFSTHDDEAFRDIFGALIQESYKDPFDLHGDDASTLDKDRLIGYFRSADKTSEVIGARQAGVFQAFRSLAGHGDVKVILRPHGPPKAPAKQRPKPKQPDYRASASAEPSLSIVAPKKDMALTVRIEINLPAEASAETYDNIFKSIKANLLDE